VFCAAGGTLVLVAGALLLGPLSDPAFPWLDCANAKVLERAKMPANAIVFMFISFPGYARKRSHGEH
jgi:hypothetical protein